MAVIDSNNAMNKYSGQLEDPTGAMDYLELVRLHLQMDWSTSYSFIVQVQHWLRYQDPESEVSQERDQRIQDCVIEMVHILRHYPKLVLGLNALLPHGHRLECSIAVKEVRFFVLVDTTGARTLETSYSMSPIELTDKSLRQTVVFENSWVSFLKNNSGREWLACVSELLKYILNDTSTDKFCRNRAYRCLRELGILPLSTLIHHKHSGPAPKKVAGGGYTDIYKGSIGKTWVCIRALKPKKDPENMKFCSEAFVWSQLRHPNILPFLGASDDLLDPEQLCFVTPWVPNGNLMDYLEANPKHDRYTSICEIVEGIKYLHELDPPVAHRDIKGSNVLVLDDGVCQLADFGLSSIEEEPKLVLSSPGFKGTLNWAAPEVIHPPASGERNHRAADVYALGCTIYEIYTGKPPHWGKNAFQVYQIVCLNAKRPPLPPPGSWSEQTRSLWWLVDRCWVANPGDRPIICLVKNYLQDIGYFKALPVHQQGFPWGPEVFQKRSEYLLRQIKIWLEQEFNSHIHTSLRQSTLVDGSFEMEKEGTTYQKYGEELDYLKHTKQASRQPFTPLQQNDAGIPTVTPNKLVPYSNIQGLFTPETPSTQLEPLSSQREDGTIPDPPLASWTQTALIPRMPAGPTPPSTPFSLGGHRPQNFVKSSTSSAPTLRADMSEAEKDLETPLQYTTSVPFSKPTIPTSTSSSMPHHRRPLSTKALMFKTDVNASSSLYRPSAVPKSRLHTVAASTSRLMRSTGHEPWLNYCSSPLKERTPLISQPAYAGVDLAPHGKKSQDASPEHPSASTFPSA